jgi:hypothetical protein
MIEVLYQYHLKEISEYMYGFVILFVRIFLNGICSSFFSRLLYLLFLYKKKKVIRMNYGNHYNV